MYQSSICGKAEDQNQFVKGMTLEQYMSNATFVRNQPDSLDESLEQNLYESSHNTMMPTPYTRKRNYRIDEIDQQSVEDSKDYHGHEDTLQTPGFEQHERTEHLHSIGEVVKQPIKTRANSISMSTAVTFKNTLPDPMHLKTKRLSVSPTKKKIEIPSSLPGASITLYGNKFGQTAPKKEKVTQMLTFYGKLNLQNGEDVLKRKTSVKEGQLKQKFKKKSHLELNKILQFESTVRGIHHSKNNYPDLRVEGFRDRRHKIM